MLERFGFLSKFGSRRIATAVSSLTFQCKMSTEPVLVRKIQSRGKGKRWNIVASLPSQGGTSRETTRIPTREFRLEFEESVGETSKDNSIERVHIFLLPPFVFFTYEQHGSIYVPVWRPDIKPPERYLRDSLTTSSLYFWFANLPDEFSRRRLFRTKLRRVTDGKSVRLLRWRAKKMIWSQRSFGISYQAINNRKLLIESFQKKSKVTKKCELQRLKKILISKINSS